MFGLGVPELLIILLLLLLPGVVLIYWLIRLAVRHGRSDAAERRPPENPPVR